MTRVTRLIVGLTVGVCAATILVATTEERVVKTSEAGFTIEHDNENSSRR